MKKNTNKKMLIMLITVLSTIILGAIGLTYAYFIVSPAHSDASSISLDIANLGDIVFKDGNEIKVSSMLPGESYTKTFTVARINSNINIDLNYAIILYVRTNTLTSVANSQFLYSLSGSTNGSGTVSSLSSTVVPTSTTQIGSDGTLVGNETHTYTFRMWLNETNADQSATLQKTFNGYLQVQSPDTFANGNINAYVSDGLVAHYDGIQNTSSGHSTSATTWYDLSGNGNNGTVSGATWDTNNLSFDGTNDYVSIGQLNQNLYTIEVVAKIDTIKSGEIFFIDNYDSGGYGLHLYNGYAGNQAYISGYKIANSSILSSINTIYNYVGTYDGNSLKIYTNGKLNNSVVASGTIGVPGNTYMMVGVNPSGSSPSDGGFFNGDIYSVRVYNRALTDQEIKRNYENDVARFSMDRTSTNEGQAYTLTNLVQNGSFESGSWSSDSRVTYYSSNGINNSKYIRITPNGTYNYFTSLYYTIPLNHKFYTSAYYKMNGGGNTCLLSLDPATGKYLFSNTYSTNTSTWTKISGISTNTTTNTNFKSLVYGACSSYVSGMYTEWDNVMAIDLTEAFGAGNEPSASWLDANIDYFDGTKVFYFDSLE